MAVGAAVKYDEDIYHFMVNETTLRYSKIFTFCGLQLDASFVHNYLSIPNRSKVCKKCADIIDKVREIMDRIS